MSALSKNSATSSSQQLSGELALQVVYIKCKISKLQLQMHEYRNQQPATIAKIAKQLKRADRSLNGLSPNYVKLYDKCCSAMRAKIEKLQ